MIAHSNKTIDDLIADLLTPDKINYIPDMSAARALAKVGQPAVEPLLKIFYEPRGEKRYLVAKALKLMGDLVLEEMLKALNHSDHHIRLIAADILGEIGDRRAVEPLIARLEKEVAKPVVPPHPKDRRWNTEELSRFYSQAEPGQMEKESRISSVRSFIVMALGKLRDSRATDALITHLDDTDDNVQYDAGRSLGQIKDIRAFEPLATHLNDNATVSGGAAIGLGELGDARAIQPLIEIALHNPAEYRDLSVRECASEALVKFGIQAVEPLIKALTSPDAGARVWSIRALGQIGDSRALPHLERLLSDNDSVKQDLGMLVVSQQAQEAIIRIKLQKLSTPELIAALQDSDEMVRRNAADTLRLRNDPSSIEALVTALDDPMERVRWQVIKALAEIGDLRTVEKLERLIETRKDWRTTIPIRDALERIRQRIQNENCIAFAR